MPLATREQYGEMLDRARSNGYALAAVNVTSSQTMHAAMRGFAQAQADGIVQITTGGASYLGGGDALAGAKAFSAMARETANAYPTLIALHTDHCPPDRLDLFLWPLLGESLERTRDGEEPLYVSQMFDGSSLPLADNLEICKELLATARGAGVILELECGVVGGAEDDIEAVDDSRLYTDRSEFLEVADTLGTGEHGRYLLAPAFGNAHGLQKSQVELKPEILAEGQRAASETRPGARFDFVFHGSSGSSRDDIRAAIANGVVKINVDSEMQLAFSTAVASHFHDHWQDLQTSKAAFDPRSWGRAGEQAMAGAVARACANYGSAGRTLA